MAILVALACQLGACAGDPAVVAQGLTLPKVPAALTRPIPPPDCALPARPDYSSAQVNALIACWQAAFADAAKQHDSLVKAVKQRERKADRLARGN